MALGLRIIANGKPMTEDEIKRLKKAEQENFKRAQANERPVPHRLEYSESKKKITFDWIVRARPIISFVLGSSVEDFSMQIEVDLDEIRIFNAKEQSTTHIQRNDVQSLYLMRSEKESGYLALMGRGLIQQKVYKKRGDFEICAQFISERHALFVLHKIKRFWELTDR